MRVFMLDDVTPAELAEVKAQMDLAEALGAIDDRNGIQIVKQLAALHDRNEAAGQTSTPLRIALRQALLKSAQGPKPAKPNGEVKSG